MTNQRQVHVRWLGGYRTEIDIRGVHRLLGDEMPQFGGDDTGPMPTEMFLSSIASCLCLAVTHIARKRRIELATLEIEAHAAKDLEAFRFNQIHLQVRADLAADKLSRLVDQAKAYCFVSNTVLQGCEIEIATESSSPAAAESEP
ncbi:MAG: OsmC family protein [Deltaproteobacteria bacterium]|nr:OsmC family protein [Deltaproteobacteria bacterium]